ncbi:MAG: TonB family protein [Desulfobacteraceae bacterium]|jgi:protein TonB
MTTKESPITYLDALSRRNWSTWAWAAAIALAMNLTLFTIMPYLLHRQPAKPVYEQLVSHINVIRMKRPDSQVQRKTAKPPEKKEELPPKPPVLQPLQAKLTLPFEINPRLPAGPTTLDLPALDNIPYMQEAFGLGDLDGPFIPLGRIPPVYPMAAKRRGIEGWVKVRFVVNEQGTVETITIVDAKPPGMFDQSVRRCVSKWRFKPGTVEGMPVKARVETTIRFELE